MGFHARAPGLLGGFLGVDLFLVLSGYLITRLLREEYRATGGIDLSRFYLRRLRRLFPALLALLVVYLATAPVVFPGVTNHALDALLAAQFLADYSRAWWNAPVILQHTWSIATEARFYLLAAPAVLLLLRTPRDRRPLVFVLLFLGCLTWRWSAWGEVAWAEAYYRFDLRLPGFLVGAAVGWSDLRAPAWLGLLGLVLAGLAVTMASWGDPAAFVFWTPCVELGTAAAIASVGRLRFLRFEPLRWLGRRSYGLYLWHYPIFYWMREVADLPWEATLLAGGTAAVVIAALSFRFVESPWLRRSGARANHKGDKEQQGSRVGEGFPG